jgi:hypothetical protein
MDQGHDVIADFLVHVNGVHHLPTGDDVFDVDHWIDIKFRGGGGHGIKDSAFFFRGGVVNAHFEQETVELRFRKGVGAFLVDRVLRGEHQEGVG